MTEDIRLHYRKIQNVLIFVLLLNWAVAAAKIFYGLLTQCSSMTADGFHSFSDGISNVIGLIGLYFCSKPPDRDHPYGHRKYETLFALGIAAFLFIVCFELIKQGVKRFYQPVVPEINIASFVVMFVTIAVNTTVMLYEKKKGKELRSDILTVDAMHTGSDLFTSLSVLVAIISVKFGFNIVDPIATLLIAGFIGYAAYKIIRQESGILCDEVAISNVKKIEKIVFGIKGVKGCHKIRSRGRPDDIHIDLHVQLNSNTSLDKAHEVSYDIEGAIRKAIPEVTDVVVHLEPLEDN